MNQFRAKRVDNNKWVFGDRVKGASGKMYIFDYDDINHTDCGIYEVIPETVGKSTGKLDKKNVDIFQGDLISCLDSNVADGVILWCEKQCMFKIKWLSKVYKEVRGQSTNYTENGEMLFQNANLVWTVIGNIHNKEVKNGK